MDVSELLPPADLLIRATGTSDPQMFRANGREFLSFFRDYANLQRNHRVLDVGCGCGRMAIPLLSYLDRGSYEGLDVDPKSIEWAAQRITSGHPHFHFQLA